MRLYPSIRRASQRLNSIRFATKAAMRLLAFALFVILLICLFPSLATAATPHIYDVPQAGPPGSQTSTVGNGWDPNATLDIYLDSTHVGLVDTDSNGTFGMTLKAPTIRQNGLTIQIPGNAVPGQHWITAVERITQIQAQVQFTVRTDWPQFHFDVQHTGFNPYENVLSSETAGNLVLDWKYTTGSSSYSSPTVANGVVYTGSWDENLYALNADTGELLWKHFLDGRVVASAAVANGVVYVGSEDGNLYALDASTGRLRWKYATGGSYTPTVANGVVYVGSGDDNVLALNASTGALLWKYTTAGLIWCSPAVANGVVYVGSFDSSIYALNAQTGALLWKYTLTHGFVESSPAVANGVVYVGSVWDHSLYALNADTGALLWQYTTGAEIVVSSPAIADGVVYVGSYDHNVYALNANTGELLWKYTTGLWIESSPAVANGVVYIGSGDGNLYVLNASSGSLLWKYTMGVETNVSSPAVVNGVVYVGSTDYAGANFYAFGLPNQQMSEKFSPPERPDPARLTPNWSLQPSSQVTPSLKK